MTIRVLENGRDVYLNKNGKVERILYLNRKEHSKYQKEILDSILDSLGKITDDFIIDYKDFKIYLPASQVKYLVKKYFGKLNSPYKVTLSNKNEEYLKKENLILKEKINSLEKYSTCLEDLILKEEFTSLEKVRALEIENR